ncbi:MAG: GPI anchored serine-threonine rich family protein [Negativicutes bacterium]|nr:GPI anchored serine-threonine rich family protein [Negativicutes bacterium]
MRRRNYLMGIAFLIFTAAFAVYGMRSADAADTNVRDGSGFFSEWNPTFVTVTSPAKASVIELGTEQKIEWDYSGYPGYKVEILLLKKGKTVLTIAKGIPVIKQSFSWRISSDLSPGEYQIRINFEDKFAGGVSEYFSIK